MNPEVGVDGGAVEYEWHEGPVPDALPVTQVYGWLLCPRTGRVLVKEKDDGAFSLPGGKPEPYDADRCATLAREAFEESQVRLGTAAYLGYQLVREPGRPPYAQVRMTAVIAEFAQRGPDPDCGRVNRRKMTSLAAAAGVLGWGPSAEAQTRAAAVVGRGWGLPVHNPAPDGYADDAVPVPRYAAVVDVDVILGRGGRVLLLRRAGDVYASGQLCLPSGHLQEGESVLDAAVRETREETGIVLDPAGLRLVLSVHHRGDDGRARIGFAFEPAAWAGEPANNEPHKHSELVWADPRALPPDTVGDTAAILRGVAGGAAFAQPGW